VSAVFVRLLRLFWRWFWQRAWAVSAWLLQLAALRLVVRVSAALGMGMAQHDITLLSTITHKPPVTGCTEEKSKRSTGVGDEDGGGESGHHEDEHAPLEYTGMTGDTNMSGMEGKHPNVVVLVDSGVNVNRIRLGWRGSIQTW
jgi:hypothetical protein